MKIYFDREKEKLMRHPGFSDLEDEEYQFSDVNNYLINLGYYSWSRSLFWKHFYIISIN